MKGVSVNSLPGISFSEKLLLACPQFHPLTRSIHNTFEGSTTISTTIKNLVLRYISMDESAVTDTYDEGSTTFYEHG
jgi:hypothetical protein